MGNLVGKAVVNKCLMRFTAWGKEEIRALRLRHCHDLGGRFSLGRDQLSSLVRQSSDTLHTIFDTDRNQYVDASEVMAAFVMLSKLSIIEKLDFVYQLYDFNGSGELGLDELTMLLRTVAVGCGKMDRAIKAPSTREVEELAKWAFRKAGIQSDSLISRGQFDDFCFYNPTVRNFLDYCKLVYYRDFQISYINQCELLCLYLPRVWRFKSSGHCSRRTVGGPCVSAKWTVIVLLRRFCP